MSRPVYYLFFKRPLDLLISLLALLFLSWLLLLILLIYSVTFNFPVLFFQYRIGKGGQPFRIYKFRTLLPDEQLPVAERQFWWGSFLRRFSLDELPQLVNVVKGEMSLIGPRPLPVEYAPLFSAEQNKRHAVRPGVTGLAQVNGRNSISWKEKLNYDVFYAEHVSWRADLRIALKTLVVLFSFKRDVSLQESRFTGNE